MHGRSIRASSSSPSRPPAYLAFGVAAFALVAPAEARAEEDKMDYADGPSGCEAFDAKNERELAEWSAAQPATPYQYPRENLVGNAPWGDLLAGLGGSLELLAATIIPHAGAQLRTEDVAGVVSWPLSVPFGPAFTCARKRGTFTVKPYRSHRLMLEPGISSSNRGVGAFVRPGYRFLYHPSDWVIGIGGGIGSTIEIAGNREPFRPSIGPEAVVQFGHCCDSSYFTFAARYDRFFGGEQRDIVWGSLGYTFF